LSPYYTERPATATPNLPNTDLIPVRPATIGGEGVQTVNARDLHAFLESKAQFATWIRERIAQCSMVDGRDYVAYSPNGEKPQGGRPSIEYELTLDMAKKLAMLERNAKGNQAREYFLECERRALIQPPVAQPAVMDLTDPEVYLPLIASQAQALLSATREKRLLEAAVQEQAPKVRFFEAVATSGGAQGIGEVAKVLGTGRTRLFAFMRECGLLMEDNMPYQRHVEAGHFIVRQRVYIDATGKSHAYSRVLVTGLGITYLQKRWADRKRTAAGVL
jgi:anti-repressor protein